MDSTLTEVGIGGIILILGLREIIPVILKYSRNGNGNGKEKTNCVTRDEFSKFGEVVQYSKNCEQVQKTFEAKIDGLTQTTNQRFNSVETGISELKELVKNGNK
jgi:hypothetical protein